MGLFNRPATMASNGTGSGSEAPKDIFSHSQSYDSILAEQERRRKERTEKQRVKQEGKGKRKSSESLTGTPRKSESTTLGEKRSGESPKRRRISGEDVGGLLKEAGLDEGSFDEDDEEAIVMEPGSAKKMSLSRGVSGRGSRSESRDLSKGNGRNAEVIAVGGSSDDEAGGNANKARSQPKPSTAFEDDEESDEELAALARQARQRRQRLQTNSATPDATFKSNTPQPSAAGAFDTGLQTPPLPDPAVKIFVHSRIEGTNPLLVYRKLSQNLKDIRLAYCKRQGFDEDFTQRVFFVHCMRRVYDVTTCRSLGLETDADGNISMKGAEGKEGVDQVVLEAVTSEIFDRMRAEKARENAKRAGQWDPENEEEVVPAAQPVAEELLGLVLKAKDKPDFKLKVKPVGFKSFNRAKELC